MTGPPKIRAAKSKPNPAFAVVPMMLVLIPRELHAAVYTLKA
jgi:hypothetical protein